MNQAPAIFIERRYPSANAVLLTGPRPVLVDPGYGSDAADMEHALRDRGVSPERLALIANTHSHCDHAGGNFHFQTGFDRDVAGHPIEAGLVNARDPDACRARFLVQAIEPYRVTRLIRDGDVIDTGAASWRVVHLPGHTLGHVGLFDPISRTLVSGDALHAADLGWINPVGEGDDPLAAATRSLDVIASLDPLTILPGHGPLTAAPMRALDRARRRIDDWRQDPDRMAIHAGKRIFVYALMIEDGFSTARLDAYAAEAPWLDAFPAFADRRVFLTALLDDLLGSGSVLWRDGFLLARPDHTPPPPGWPRSPTRPSDWPDLVVKSEQPLTDSSIDHRSCA